MLAGASVSESAWTLLRGQRTIRPSARGPERTGAGMPHEAHDQPQDRGAGPIADRAEDQWASWRFQPALLDQAQVGIIVSDVTGTIRECNRHAESMYGRPRTEIIGADAMAIAGQLVPRELMAEIAAALVNGETWEGDFKITRADGTVIDVHAIDSGILNPEGRLEGIISV